MLGTFLIFSMAVKALVGSLVRSLITNRIVLLRVWRTRRWECARSGKLCVHDLLCIWRICSSSVRFPSFFSTVESFDGLGLFLLVYPRKTASVLPGTTPEYVCACVCGFWLICSSENIGNEKISCEIRCWIRLRSYSGFE